MRTPVRHIFLSLLFALSLSVQPVSAQYGDTFGTIYKALRLLQGGAKAYEALTITDEDLAVYAAQSMEQEDSKHKVCAASSQYAQRLARITKGMNSINGLHLNFKVYVSKEANAFASPDGSVRVYSALMDIMTDDQLLGVIGHELGHLAGRHSLKQYRAALLASAVRDGLLASDGTIGELAASSVGALTEVLFNAKYSRDQEREADRYGFQYLKKCGKDPEAMAGALRKLLELQNNPTNRYYRYMVHLFSTHPDLEERIELLEKMR